MGSGIKLAGLQMFGIKLPLCIQICQFLIAPNLLSVFPPLTFPRWGKKEEKKSAKFPKKVFSLHLSSPIKLNQYTTICEEKNSETCHTTVQ
jgi:hypothetical protein